MENDNFAREFDLNVSLDSYYRKKERLDYYKKETENENEHIKELMKDLNLNKFTNDNGLTAKIITSKKETFNEPALIEKLIEIGAKEAIELVPKINWDTVEDMLYNGKLNATELTTYKEEKEVVSLRVSKKKGE